MAENKTSFILYEDSIDVWEELTDEDAGQLIKHLFRYVNDQNPETVNPMVKLAFIPMKQHLKRDLKKYSKKADERSVSGVVGNLKRWHPDIYKRILSKEISIEEGQDIANDRKPSLSDNSDKEKSLSDVPIADSVSVNDSVNDSVIKKEKAIEPKVVFPFTSKNFKTVWEGYKNYRKKKNSKFSFANVDSENRKLVELENLSGKNELNAIKILQQTIDNNWSGFFQLKNNAVITPQNQKVRDKIAKYD